MKPRIAGIDFGTTTCVIAVPSGDRVITLAGKSGDLLPSVVTGGLRSIKRFFGRTADEIMRAFPELPARKIFAQPPLRLTTAEGLRTPAQLASGLLKTLAARAAAYYGGALEGAVITVPAYFDELQRQTVLEAAHLASIPVLRLIHEPTAAAIAYGLGGLPSSLIAVYDLGGGTFDFTLLNCRAQTFEVLGTGGHSALGGDDLDRLLAEALLARCRREAPDLRPAFSRFRSMARSAKHRLSVEAQVRVKYRRWSCTLTRADLASQVEPLVEQTFSIVAQVLRRAQVTVLQITHLLLVGGSTRLETIQRACCTFFGRAPESGIDPERMVAMGAALQAQQLQHASTFSLIDVTPLSLGIETLYGGVEVIIPRNTPLPARKTELFTNALSGQTQMLFHVVQGEHLEASACRSLGRFTLESMPLLPAGAQEVQVTFSVDCSGVLHVSAQERTGVQAQTVLEPNQGLSEAQFLTLLPSSALEEASRTLTFLEHFPATNEPPLEALRAQLHRAVAAQDLLALAPLIEAIKAQVLARLWSAEESPCA